MRARKFREEQGKNTVYHHKGSVDDLMEAFAKDETALIESSWRLQKQRGDDLEVEIKELRGLLDKVKETLPEWDKIYPGLAEKIINI